MWREKIVMIGFEHAEVLKLMEQQIQAEVGRPGMMSVKKDFVELGLVSYTEIIQLVDNGRSTDLVVMKISTTLLSPKCNKRHCH